MRNALAQTQEELQLAKVILYESELLESHFLDSTIFQPLERELQQAGVDCMRIRLQGRCSNEDLRRALNAFDRFWSTPISRNSKEDLQHLIFEGYNYHDVLDETTAHFVPSPPQT